MKRQTNQIKRQRKGFLTLLSMLISLIIVGILVYLAVNTYFKKSSLNKPTEESMAKEGLNTSTPSSIIDSTRRQVDEINKRTLKQQQDLEAIQ